MIRMKTTPTGSRHASRLLTLALVAMLGGPVYAKLPPPTPEEQAAAAQKAEIAAAQLAQEKQALERIQDQLAARYGKGAAGTAQETATHNLPKTVQEAPGDTGPKGGTKPSAEAHSGNVK